MPWTINNVAFDSVDRELIDAEPVDVELTRVGQDGTAFQVEAYRAATQQIITTVQKATNAARAFRESCKKMELTTAEVIDQHGANWFVYIRRVRVSWRQQINGMDLIQVAWTLVPRSERP